MTYTLFLTGAAVSKSAYEAQKPRWQSYRYDELDDALAMSRDINARGGIAWEIENDGGGPTLTRDQIEIQVFKRRAELAGRPKVR